MRLHELTEFHAKSKIKRVGRGISSGQGKTAGRGTKGQKARTGANSNIPRTFQGAATSMIQRFPKLKGFKSKVNKPISVSVQRISEKFTAGEVVTVNELVARGLISLSEAKYGVKIIGSTNIKKIDFSIDTSDNQIKTTAQVKNI